MNSHAPLAHTISRRKASHTCCRSEQRSFKSESGPAARTASLMHSTWGEAGGGGHNMRGAMTVGIRIPGKTFSYFSWKQEGGQDVSQYQIWSPYIHPEGGGHPLRL